MRPREAIVKTMHGDTALVAGGTVIARRPTLDGRTEFVVLGQHQSVYRGPLKVADLRAFVDASFATGERVRCAPLQRQAGGRRILLASADDVRA